MAYLKVLCTNGLRFFYPLKALTKIFRSKTTKLCKSNDAELVTNAVKNACLNIKNTRGMIFYSDLGSQYTSDIFENYLSSKGIKHSFSRKGNPYDNTCIESFHSLLKKEMIYCKEYHSFEEAQFDIFEYIESWYNRKRRHAFLNYKTPQEVEDYALNL